MNAVSLRSSFPSIPTPPSRDQRAAGEPPADPGILRGWDVMRYFQYDHHVKAPTRLDYTSPAKPHNSSGPTDFFDDSPAGPGKR